MNVVEAKPSRGTEQRLDAEKSNSCRCTTEMLDAPSMLSILHTQPEPDIRRWAQRRRHVRALSVKRNERARSRAAFF